MGASTPLNARYNRGKLMQRKHETMDVQTRFGMPMDEFIRLYEEAPFELIDGERIALVPPVAIHVYIVNRLLTHLIVYLQSNPVGEAFAESTFVLSEESNWVKGSRVPDIAFYQVERWQTYIAETADWGEKPFMLVPYLCVEVISKNDMYDDVSKKVTGYLEDGVRLVWVINPRGRTIHVHTAGSNQIKLLTADDTLTGGDVLSGFAVAVKDIFPS